MESSSSYFDSNPSSGYDNVVIFADDYEDFTEEEFHGLDVLDEPPLQVDDDFQYMHPHDYNQLLKSNKSTLPSSSNSRDNLTWDDVPISKQGEAITFELDSIVKETWEIIKCEVEFLKNNVKKMLGIAINETTTISFNQIYSLSFGKSSIFANTFCKEIGTDYESYCRFMASVTVQMAYRQSPSSMYSSSSLSRHSLIMEEDAYVGLWSQVATMKKVPANNFISDGRRHECLWEIFESAINCWLRRVTIAGRNDTIKISLDDDKIWNQQSGRNKEDQFKLRRVTHVKDNRKGIVSHTAVLSSTTMLAAFIFEKSSDTAVACMKKNFSNLFPPNAEADDTLPDLSSVEDNSDRGYTIFETVFQFLLPAGADLTNTVKRIMPFPFVWGMKVRDTDPRKVPDEHGAPTLYIRETMFKNRLITCSAFRTGTGNISAVVTTKIHGHRWEGVCLSIKERIAYEKDCEHGLDHLFFPMLASYRTSLFEENKEMIEDVLKNLHHEIKNIISNQATEQCLSINRKNRIRNNNSNMIKKKNNNMLDNNKVFHM